MQEVEGLTVAAIDWLLDSVRRETKGLGSGSFELDGYRCALGTIGFAEAEFCNLTEEKHRKFYDRARRVGLLFERPSACMTCPAITVTEVNDRFNLSPKGRRLFMLSWLRAQRALKCSDWTPPIRESEVVRDREAVLA